MISNADSQSTEKKVQEDADANSQPCGVPEYSDDAQVHCRKEADFDGLELVTNRNGWSGRERHTYLSHEDTSNARPDIRPKAAGSFLMYDCPVEIRHQGRRARETNPSPFCEAIRLASEIIIPVCRQTCT